MNREHGSHVPQSVSDFPNVEYHPTLIHAAIYVPQQLPYNLTAASEHILSTSNRGRSKMKLALTIRARNIQIVSGSRGSEPTVVKRKFHFEGFDVI